MKTQIITELEDTGIKVGDAIPQATRISIIRSLCGDSPAKYNKFYAAWYQVTNDEPGCGTYPNLPIRTK